jgi:hypothetical protein
MRTCLGCDGPLPNLDYDVCPDCTAKLRDRVEDEAVAMMAGSEPQQLERVAAIYGLAVQRRFRWHWKNGKAPEAAAALAGWDAWLFLATASEGNQDLYAALGEWLRLEAMV